jgi:hypothetical protein
VSAHAIAAPALTDPGPLRAPGFATLCLVLIAIGLLGIPAAYFWDHGGIERIWSSILQGLLIPTYLGACSLFYIAVHNIGGAHWLTPYRRIIEGFSAGLPIALVAVLAIGLYGGLWLYDHVYQSHPLGGAHSHYKGLFHVEGGSKSGWMNWIRVLVTTSATVALWWWFRTRLVGNSLRQDVQGGVLQKINFKTSLFYIFAFGLGITFLVWDLLLSLHLNWFSTMWGVYCFTSGMQTFLCVLILVALWLRRGPLKHHLPHHVLHDLGTWMVAWSCFCAYIGFSQFMLIYYANLDEETYWYVLRTQNGYGLQYAIEAIIRWPVVFLGLMSQSVRANPRWLATIAVIALVGNWIDWSWIIFPAFSPNEYRCPFAPGELMIGAGFLGGTLFLAHRFWQRHGVVPKKDPYLESTVHGEHLH